MVQTQGHVLQQDSVESKAIGHSVIPELLTMCFLKDIALDW